MALTVTEALVQRRSTRKFLDKKLDWALVKSLLEKAQRAPSGGNVQPWNVTVMTGQPLQNLIAEVLALLPKGEGEYSGEYPIYPEKLPEPYRRRRYEVGEALYASLNIARDDKMGRMMQMAENFKCFGAPVLILLHCPRYMGQAQWSDMGMWLQSLMLLAEEAGLASCAQEIWSLYTTQVKKAANIPDDHIFFCGLSLGYADGDAPVNNYPVPRAPLDEVVTAMGFTDAE